MRRFVMIVLVGAIAISSCGKKNKYHEMKVYPTPKEASVVRGQDSFLVLQVEIPADSHIYGNPKGPGTGKPTEIFVQAPNDFLFRSARFLPPKKFYFPGEREYTLGYEHETRIFIPYRVSEKAKTGVASITVILDSLLCTDLTGSGGSASCTPQLFRLTCPILVLNTGAAVYVHDPSIIAEYEASTAPESAGGRKRIITEEDSTVGDSTLLSALSFTPRFLESGVTGIIEAVLFGIIAGIILNFMPCVLPVVSLKVMSFVQHAGRSRKELILLGILFSSGILTSFVFLASLAAFFSHQWGALFQNRLFLVIMTGIVFALALSLFGVYTIAAPGVAGRASAERGNHYIDAYVKGLLATLLATPCSGPFLGGTLAWTLSQQPYIIFIVFMCIGFGMALPYIVLTISPKLLMFIPKPGEWLSVFEHVMGFLLIFTTIYLISIFDADSVLPMVTFLGFIAVGFWQYGRYGAVYQAVVKRVISSILLVVIIVLGYFISFTYLYAENDADVQMENTFSVGRLLKNRDEGTISVIEFTADWCPNCRLVERVSLNTDAVRTALREADVDFMIADITVKNPQAERLMSMLRSQSIPLLAVIPPGKSFSAPIILRDIYSAHDVLQAITMARSEREKKGVFQYQVEIQNVR